MPEDFSKADAVSLKEHLICKINALDERVTLMAKLNQLAVDKAVTVINDRLASMNEFREAMKDQHNRFLTKEEYKLSSGYAQDQLRKLETAKASLDGKADQAAVTRTTILALISVFFGLAGFIFALINMLK